MPLDSTPLKPLAEDSKAPAQRSSALDTTGRPETRLERDARLRKEHFHDRKPEGRRVSYGNEDR